MTRSRAKHAKKPSVAAVTPKVPLKTAPEAQPQVLAPIHLSSEQLKAATEIQWKVYAIINEWVRFADTKAAALLATSGVLAYITASALTGQRSFLINHPFAYEAVVLGGFLLLLCAMCSLSCLMPRLGAPRSDPSSKEQPLPPIFFAHIITYQPGEYMKVSSKLADAELAYKQICLQVWANARVATRKHAWVRRAVFFLGAAMLFGVIAAVLAALGI